MTLILRVDNFDAMPDGGPIQYQSERRGFDIGRDSHLDWSLPDPNRHISSKHCEVRFENGSYLLYDVSTNGTYLNGSSDRIKSPHQLRDGDRLAVGHYIISVHVAGAAAPAPDPQAMGAGQAFNPGAGPETGAWTPAHQPPSFASDDIWASDSAAPAPIDRRDLIPPKARAPREAGYEDQFVDLPATFENPALLGGAPQPAAPPPAATPPVAPHPAAPLPAAPPGVAQPAAPPSSAMPIPGGSNPAFPAGIEPAPNSEPFMQAPGARPAEWTPPPAAPAPSGADAPFSESEPFTPAAVPQPQEPSLPPMPPLPDSGIPTRSAGGEDFLAHFAKGARINPADLAHLDRGALAEDVGVVMRLVVEHLSVLLAARAKAKVITKSANRTMLAADDNNPLKFLPTPEEILTVMFARSRRGFKDARGSVSEAFSDLEKHEFATIFAMQKALGKLLEDISPDAIESDLKGSVFASKQAKAWQTFVERWEAKNEPHENGMLDEFLAHFSDFYDQQNRS